MKYLISSCLALLIAALALAEPPKQTSRPPTYKVPAAAQVILARYTYVPPSKVRQAFFDRICTQAAQTDPALMALIISQLSAANRAQPVADPNTAAVLAQLSALNGTIQQLALRPAQLAAPAPQIITVPGPAAPNAMAGDCCQSLKDQLSANQAALLSQAQQNQAALLQTLATNHAALLAAMDANKKAILDGQVTLLAAISSRSAPAIPFNPPTTVPVTPPVTVVNVPPATQPYYPPSYPGWPGVQIPTTPPSITIPTSPPSVTIPTTPPGVVIPTTPPGITVPVTPPSVTVPISPPSVRIPVGGPSVTVPPAVPIPPAIDTTPPSTTIPGGAPRTTIPTTEQSRYSPPVTRYIRLGVYPPRPAVKPIQKPGVYATR